MNHCPVIGVSALRVSLKRRSGLASRTAILAWRNLNMQYASWSFLKPPHAPGLASRESTPSTSTVPARLTGSGSSGRSYALRHPSVLQIRCRCAPSSLELLADVKAMIYANNATNCHHWPSAYSVHGELWLPIARNVSCGSARVPRIL